MKHFVLVEVTHPTGDISGERQSVWGMRLSLMCVLFAVKGKNEYTNHI